MSKLRDFSGKVIIITGSGSGIGKTVAIHLASLGACITITDRHEKSNDIKKVAEKCREISHAKVIEVMADVTNEYGAKQIINRTIEEFGKIDILINNAAVAALSPITASNLMDIYSRVMDTNLRAVIFLTSLAIPYLEITKGTVINISSAVTSRPNANFSIYTMSKKGLDMFTKCMALELGPKGIRVNSINPSVIQTPLYNTVGVSIDKLKKNCSETYPLHQIGHSKDVTMAIEFLASDDASFITGNIMLVDGGADLRP